MKTSPISTVSASNICARHSNNPSALIEILHDVQEVWGFVPEVAQVEIAEALNLTRAEVHGVTSFYEDFRKSAPIGAIVKVCRGEACQSMGANGIAKDINTLVGSRANIEIEAVYCLGNCALAPAAMINGRLYGRLDENRLADLIDEAVS